MKRGRQTRADRDELGGDGGTEFIAVHRQRLADHRVKAKKRQATFELSTADATCNQYGRFTVKLKPNAQARKALKDYKQSLPVTLTLRLAGPIGTTTALRSITLKGKGRG